MRNSMIRITAKNDTGQFINSTSWKHKTPNQFTIVHIWRALIKDRLKYSCIIIFSDDSHYLTVM